MSVLFLTEGSKIYGRGHLSRCEAVADALLEKSKECSFIIDAPEDFTVSTPGSKYYFDWKKDRAQLKEKIERLKLVSNTRVIYTDSYYLDEELIAELAATGLQLFIMDDQGMYDYGQGSIINPTISAQKTDYKKHKPESVYTGARYIPLKKEFWHLEPLSYLERKGVLVTLGASDTNESLQNIIDALQNYGEQITVIAPGAGINAEGNIKLITSFIDAAAMREHMLHCRAIVCAGGGTLLEAARCGTPAVVVKVAENQDLNIKAWSNLGYSRYAGLAGEAKLGANVLTELKAFNDHLIWRKASQIGNTLIDGMGAQRIADLINEAIEGGARIGLLHENYELKGLIAKNFLKCTHKEHLDIMEARNSELVRKGSINSRAISMEEHQAFLLTLGQSVSSGYWRLYKNFVPFGVVSLTSVDFPAESAVLGYYKHPTYPEKGVGAEIVGAAVEIAFENLGLSRITAETFSDNHASVSAMESAGFRRIGSEKRMIQGNMIVVYIYEINK